MMLLQSVTDKLKRRLRNVPRAGVELGLPTSWFGYRWIERETVPEYFARHGGTGEPGRYDTLHTEAVARHPLPRNVTSLEDLPNDRGWWGFSFRDVPTRRSGETKIITLPECRITWYRDATQDNDFYPAILTRDDRALDLREVRFRDLHGEVLRASRSAARVDRATWILERVYHNHSHWLTAHLPKILLLRERGGLEEIMLPRERTPTMDGSLRMLGLDPDAFRTFDHERPLEIAELTFVQNDRFRPELLRMVQAAFAASAESPTPHRRVFVSRGKAARRNLVNEDEIWTTLEKAGFERVYMEDLSFEDQVLLMRETAILVGPHGAGLTNMIFCSPGADVVEIADLSFPNPNFYALASGLKHDYWLLAGETVGSGHPLERNLRIDISDVESVLKQLLS